MPHVYTIDGVQMTLPTLRDAPEPVNEEVARVTRRLWIAVGVLAVAVVIAIPVSVSLAVKRRRR